MLGVTLQCSCLALALVLGKRAGAQPFGSHLLYPPPHPGQVILSLGTLSSFAGKGRERLNCFLIFSFVFFFSHAAEQKVRPEFSTCPWEAVYQDWVSLQDVCFIFLHYKAFWNSILLATGLVFGTEGTGCEADRPGLFDRLLRVG